MNTQTASMDAAHGNNDDFEYNAFLRRVQDRFITNVILGGGKLFTTNAEGLWDAFLGAMPPEQRQYHTCHACRHFIERFGGLVTIDASGLTTPAVWNEDDAPELYKPAVNAMERMVRRAGVSGVFLSSEPVWGTPVTGIWHHFSVKPQEHMLFRRVTLTANQAMAEKREDFNTLIRGLNEFTLPVIEQALNLLRTESLYRSEKVLGPALWLCALHVARNAAHGLASRNVTWLAVASAPAGFCHPRSSMIGTLLEDIAAGLPFEDVKRKFADKMHPLQYQRPQAAPPAGNIAQGEKLVEQMGIKASFRRRYARLDEIDTLWLPTPPKEEPRGEGVFSHLKPKQAVVIIGAADMPAITMTWEKFRRIVLPEALEIEFFAPHNRDNYAALVTSVDPAAPPILQWDLEERRNPVSWYLYNNGSTADYWGLESGRFHKVTAVTLKPSMWRDDKGQFAHQGQGVIFILAGAKDITCNGLALFPETLRSELHQIRSTIEAFSSAGKIEGAEDASACGISLGKGGNWSARFRVRTKTGTVEYKLDRWD
jgi:hypothetical protein